MGSPASGSAGLYAREYVIDAINRIRGPFNVNAAAQAAGAAALGDPEHLAAAVAHNARWRPWLSRQLRELGLEVPPSAGNFVLIRFQGRRPGPPRRRGADGGADSCCAAWTATACPIACA